MRADCSGIFRVRRECLQIEGAVARHWAYYAARRMPDGGSLRGACIIEYSHSTNAIAYGADHTVTICT